MIPKNKYTKGLYSVRTGQGNYSCLPAAPITDDIFKNKRKKYESQKRRYGFDERELWSLDYTSYVWLYSHLKALIEADMVDWEWKGNFVDSDGEYTEYGKRLIEAGVPNPISTEAVIDYLIQRIEEADRLIHCYNKNDKTFDNEKQGYVILAEVFRIYGVLLPELWW